jgi:hypothetical protein
VNREQKPATDFEQRLLAQLRAVVAERGAAEAASGAAGASAIAPARRRPSPRLALAGAGALAAIVAAILVVSSGPSAEPAAAEVLRQTAAVAATADTHSRSTPGAGQFLYTKTKRLELQEWVPGSYSGSFGAMIPKPRGAFDALNTWQEEEWWSADGPSRSRWVMGTPQFFSGAELGRWEKAGSPLPGSFDCDKRCFPGARIIELRPGVTDVENEEGPSFPDFSTLPTEPEALRLTVEQRQVSGPPSDDEAAARPINAGQVIAELWDILDKPNTTPALRAAVFGALAELPGIELDRSASDLVGRSGYALGYESTSSSSYGEQQPGKRVEYIFDPETSAILGRREIIVDPEKLLPWAQGISAGTVWREVAYLQSGIVDSTRERPDERNGEPVATTDPAHRKQRR